MRTVLNKERTMNKEHKMRKLPIVIAAALAFLAIGGVENANARPLDIGGGHMVVITTTDGTATTTATDTTTHTNIIPTRTPFIVGSGNASGTTEFGVPRTPKTSPAHVEDVLILKDQDMLWTRPDDGWRAEYA